MLAQAIAYTQIFFGGAVAPWLMNTMAGVLRGTGNMKLPSMMMFSSAICQIFSAARSVSVSARSRNSACAASPPAR